MQKINRIHTTITNLLRDQYSPLDVVYIEPLHFATCDRLRADCDGVTDDSMAVSNALASIGNGHCSPVLLIPGMCRITKKP